MKLNRFQQSVLMAAGLVAFVSFSVAGPGASSGHRADPASAGPGFSSTNNPGVLGRTASDGTQFNSSSNPGTQGGAFGQSTAADASGGSSDGSSNGSNGSENASSTGLSHRNANAALAPIGRGEERMVVTPDKGESSAAGEAAGKSEKSETTKKFESNLLFAGVSPIPSATPSQGVNPVPSATVTSHPPDAPPKPSPIPSASRPEAHRGVSPIPSATVSHGISPVPSAAPRE